MAPVGAPPTAPTAPPTPSAPTGGSGARALRRGGAVAALVVVLVLAVVLSLGTGTRAIPAATVLHALVTSAPTPEEAVVRELRLPRTAAGLLAGGALGVAGGVVQGLTRNPLADPGLLGISQGAAAGVVVAIAVAGVADVEGYVGFAVVGAVLTAALVTAIARRVGSRSPVSLVLAGAAVSALVAALTTAVLTTSGATLDQFRFWQVGALTDRSGAAVAQVVPLVVAGAVLAAVVSRGLDALVLGEDVARSLGGRVGTTVLVGALSATLLTAGAVAVAGPLVFVGLVGPHLARLVVGPRHRVLLPVAALVGAALVLVADVAGRLVAPPAEVPAGVLTAVVGVPVLLVLLRGRRVAGS